MGSVLTAKHSRQVCYFPGAGAFFFWQLGFAQELEARCARKHLRTTRLIGCSAGALVAALATAEVSPQRALDLAAKRPLTTASSWAAPMESLTWVASSTNGSRCEILEHLP